MAAPGEAPRGSADPLEGRTVVDGVDVLGSLSPSRASDFMTCPLLYRFRTIDRLPEPFSPDAVRGTVVHKVLEDLFDLPALDRTPERAADLLVPTWDVLLEAEPGLAVLGEHGRQLRLCVEHEVQCRLDHLPSPLRRALGCRQVEEVLEHLVHHDTTERARRRQLGKVVDGAEAIHQRAGLEVTGAAGGEGAEHVFAVDRGADAGAWWAGVDRRLLPLRGNDHSFLHAPTVGRRADRFGAR